MFQAKMKSSLLSAALAAGVLMVGMHDADAAARRLAFDPNYGTPFTDLGWRGEAVVDFADGSCDGPGGVSNVFGPCAGTMSFVSASVNLYSSSDPGNVGLQQNISFTGGQVFQMTFDGANELTGVVSTPFNPVQGTLAQTEYMGNQAYFSLVFVGQYAQLIWFKSDPGNFLLDPLEQPFVQLPNALTYVGCYLAGPGDNAVGKNRCGISSNLDGQGAALKITPVPEPETYAMMFLGLGALAFMARRRRVVKH
jgi:hypothetical protein